MKEGEIVSWEDVGEGRKEQRGETSFKVTLLGTQSQEVEGALVRYSGPEGHHWCDSASAQEDLLPHLRQPLIYLSLCAGAANNQLKLADFSTFVREPAALAQLSICGKGSREPEKKKKKLLSHYSYSFPYSLPLPLALSTAMPLFSSSFFF